MFKTPVCPLQPGDIAPEFSTVDVMGKKVSLNSVDSRYILLVFFRYSGCPWCNLAIQRLTLEYERLKEQDCEVITFIQSDKSSIETNVYGRHTMPPPFSIIADRAQKFYKLYGVQKSAVAAVRSLKHVPTWLQAATKHGFMQNNVDGNLFIVPASFLIDGRTGKIAQTSYGRSFYEADAFLEIYQSVFFKEL